MQLALRKTPPTNGKWHHKAFSALTKWRLVSEYCHGAVIIDGVMYQINKDKGLFATTDYSPELWDIYEWGGDDQLALWLIKQLNDRQVKYDVIGLLTFVLPWNFDDVNNFYCFELCAYLRDLDSSIRWTPEKLLSSALQYQQGIN